MNSIKAIHVLVQIIVAINLNGAQYYQEEHGMDGGRPTAQTYLGRIRGIRANPMEFLTNEILRRSDLSPKPVNCFLGIPYAKPPLNELRFKLPQPAEPFKGGMLEAVKISDSCPQPLLVPTKLYDYWNPVTPQSEDCLYLNIWAPAANTLTGSNSYPVMIFIHGGAYESGGTSIPMYDGKILASLHDVIIVNINYRLGALGFLYTGTTTDDNPGNMGLYDQQMAFKWVKENIRNFQGDPERISIAGESAGGASVSLHLLSPSSWPYFARGIMQSGSATSSWAIQHRGVGQYRAYMLAKDLGCNVNVQISRELERSLTLSHDVEFKLDSLTRETILRCLREKTHEQIISSKFQSLVARPMDFPFVPVVDGKLIPNDPFKLLDKGKFKKTDILGGSNLNETTLFLLDLVPVFQPVEKTVLVSNEDMIKTLDAVYFRLNDVSRAAIKFFYTNLDIRNFNKSIPVDMADNLIRTEHFTEDYSFVCGVTDMTKAYTAQGNNAYGYQFRHRSSQSTWPTWMGVVHGDEIPFVFAMPLKKGSKYLEEEKRLSRLMSTLWTNFIKTGNPSVGTSAGGGAMSSSVDEIWPNYVNQEALMLNVGMLDNPSTILGPNFKGCYFQKYLRNLNAQTKNCAVREQRRKEDEAK